MKNNFTERDEANLASSFITLKLAELAKIRRVTSNEGAETLGRKPTANEDLSGLISPYFHPNDWNNPRDYRLRLDNPELDKKGKPKSKYLASFGSKNKIYFPPNIKPEILADVSLPIVFCEGEKKCLALWRVATDDLNEPPTFLPLGLSGVWNWKETFHEEKREMADFHSIVWQGRKIIILFDTDAKTNWQVGLARKRLAEHLQAKNAITLVCEMPETLSKGVDDLLGFWSKESVESAINKCFELLDKSKPFESKEFYLSGNLIIKFGKAERNKTKIFLFRENGLIHSDELTLTKSDDREKFVKTLDLTDDEKSEIKQKLLELSLLKPKNETAEKVTEEKSVLSQILSDGRIIEALSTRQLAVYDSISDSVEYLESIVDDGVNYRALDDAVTQDGLLIDAVETYSSETDLISDIKNYISRHYDLALRELKICAYYILLTYLADFLFEVPYLHPQGASGSGKTRFGEVMTFASYRPFVCFTATEASLFRAIDRYKPTVFLDEFNLQDSSDSNGIMQVLNAGWSKTGKVRRCNDSGEIENFSPFGCKLIASLQKMQSDALESRCVAIQTKETNRDDIRFANVGQIQRDAIGLRRKLTMYRFRNFNRDFESEMIQAETELKQYGIRPRVIQKATPLFMLIKDAELKKQFIEILQAETRVTKEMGKEGFDFEVVFAIHEILFKTVDENEVELNADYQRNFENTFTPKTFYAVQTVDGEICEALTVENIVERLNDGKPEKEKIRNDRFGRTLAKRFNLETKVVWSRHSEIRGKRAVIFNLEKLATLFQNYSLPVSQEFTVATIAKDDKPNQHNDLQVATVKENQAKNKVTIATHKSSQTNNLNGLAIVATVGLPETDGNSKNDEKRMIIEI
jgi:hypothetical protein